MKSLIQELYYQEIDQAHLDLDADPDYQAYLAQAQTVWQDEDMPQPIFDLLDHANFLSFAHGFRLGIALMKWADR